MTAVTMSGDVTSQLRRALLDLARREDDAAATEAAVVPYWKSLPPSVEGHRAAAAALREEADRLLARLGSAVPRLGIAR